MDFSTFRDVYPAREPAADKIKNDDELMLIPESAGLQFFPTTLNDIRLSEPPRVYGARGNTYLWAIGLDKVPVAIESLEFGKMLKTPVIKHTNLTGGARAHCGGELWFVAEKSMLIGGSSGRYGPKSDQELVDAVASFKCEGFQVASMGFDEETGEPNTVLVGQPKWQ
ncbi:hypothetical protein NLK61_14425 [Pseudomonas fuscovaginae UPB0736]|uniref:hypothetical protein n=1 Tax=Pseudomonas asplenii TaxID=53407 RepID=UPI000289268A|nr:hypothetical protein [Pseudomonas fuscovaginae]UUQ67771.1 hypothetical protein NLK61_14425 [Pseudomonas fuscovaginae UPB0736]